MNHPIPIMRTNPFPGLRPFTEDEEYLFFGRENQVDAMIDKLAGTHFLAVVGTSGSGKSSLVNCGLRPALRRGLMASAGTAWRIAQFRPGNDPIGALARALAQKGVLFPGDAADGLPLDEIIETTLRMSKDGLIDIFEQARLDDGVNLLVVADQFEELFRYRQVGVAEDGKRDDRRGEDAAALVSLMLEVKQKAAPIFVVLTMRSDFFGDCAQFPGLAEAINAGQYLVPQMTRDERRAAIAGPVKVSGGEIEPVLLTRLVNDVGDNPDQLPILQHALNRTWAHWRDRGAKGPLALADYLAIGTMANALDQHAEQAYSDLGDQQARKICEKLFKALTDKATDPRGIRRPTALRALCSVVEATEAELVKILDVFRDPRLCFLMPPSGEALASETAIDISHESLMRIWRRLDAWADEEARWARGYRRLAETASLHASGAASLWRDPELQLALDWREKCRPNEAWASRYHPGFTSAMDFLAKSSHAREREQIEAERLHQRELAIEQEKAEAQARYARRMRLAALSSMALAGVAIIAAGVAGWAFLQTRAAEKIATVNGSRALVALSEAARLQDQYSDAVKLALAAWPRSAHDKRPMLSHTIDVLAQALAGPLEVTPPLRHGGKVFSVGYSPDGSRVVTASTDKTAQLWDSRTGAPIGKPLQHDSAVVFALFSPDGKRVATASNNAGRVWDAATGAPIGQPLRHNAAVNDVDFSPDGKQVVTASADKTARVWDAATGAPIGGVLEHDGAVRTATFSPDGKRIVTASAADNTARIWDVATGARIGEPMRHQGAVYGAAFSPDSAQIVTASADNTAQVWDATTTAPVGHRMEHDGSVYTAAFSPDGLRIVTASVDKTARIWIAATGKPVGQPIQHLGAVNMAVFSPDGAKVATASDDNTARVWNAQTGRPFGKAFHHNERVTNVTFSPQGAGVATASADKTARLWDMATDKVLQHRDSVLSASFSPDGTRVVSASRDNTARIWNAETGAPIGKTLQHDGQVDAANFSPDGSRVLTASHDRTARLWDAATGEPIGKPFRHGGLVYSATFSPDGARLVTGSSDNTARVWDAATGAPIGAVLRHLDNVNSASFSPEGARIVTASDDWTARVWDARTGAPIGPPLQHADRVLSASFSPDGRHVATASSDNTARVWDAATGAPMGKPMQHESWVNSAVFSPDGARLLTASEDGTARVWDAATGTPIFKTLRHGNEVYGASFSADGKRIVTASADNTARVWDAGAGAPIGSPLLRMGPVRSALFSPDGSRVVIASDDANASISPTPQLDGNIIATACKKLGDHDTEDISARYSISIDDPICTPGTPSPDLAFAAGTTVR